MAALSQRRRVYVHYEGQNGPYRDGLAISAGARGAEGSVKSEVAVSGAFGDRLIETARANDSLLCVGLDPVRSRFPSPLDAEPDLTRAIVSFNTGVIAATSDLVCAYKPNLGFDLATVRPASPRWKRPGASFPRTFLSFSTPKSATLAALPRRMLPATSTPGILTPSRSTRIWAKTRWRHSFPAATEV